MKELSTGASCNRDAEKLAKEIERYATLFFNFSLLPYARQLGKQKYDDTFFLINLDEIGEEDYNDFTIMF